jgi:hypothetical protein
MYALFIAVFFLNSHGDVQGGMFSSMEECQEKLQTVPTLIAEYNADAENPVKIVAYNAGCVPMKKAPQGKDV